MCITLSFIIITEPLHWELQFSGHHIMVGDHSAFERPTYLHTQQSLHEGWEAS
jgi:hypothetical protein